MCTAGRLGSQALPEVASATQTGKDDKYTVIYNAGAIKLAEWKE
jgi:oxidoreductase